MQGVRTSNHDRSKGSKRWLGRTEFLTLTIQSEPRLETRKPDLPIPITDLVLQPGTNTLYGTRLSEEDFTNSIYTISPATGVATLIGNTGVIGATLAFGPDGTPYQTSAIFDDDGFVAGYLNTLDPDTGAVLTTSDPFTSPRRRIGGASH